MVQAMREAKKLELEVEVLASPAAASLWLEVTAPAHVSYSNVLSVVAAQRQQLAARYPGCVFADPDPTFAGHRCLVTIFTPFDVASQYSMVVKEVRVRFVVPGETSAVPRPNVLKTDTAAAAATVAAAVEKRLVTQVETATGAKMRAMGEDDAASESSGASDASDVDVRAAAAASVEAVRDVVTAVKAGLEAVLPTLARAGVTAEERTRIGTELGKAVPDGLGAALAFIDRWKSVQSASDVTRLLESRSVAVTWADRLRSAPQPPPPSAWNKSTPARKPKAGKTDKNKGAPKKGK
jgi:hypothetical protein